MDFIHDLTANGDFSSRQSFNLPRFLSVLSRQDNEDFNSKNLHRELVLTGDAHTRRTKRYCVDYETDANICDCCGRSINKKPWDFKKLSKLCDECEIFWEEIHSEKFKDSLNLVVGEDSSGFITRRQKPWDFPEDRNDDIYNGRAIDNVLLWD